MNIVRLLLTFLLSVGCFAQTWVDRTNGNGPGPTWTRPSMGFDPVRGHSVLVQNLSQGNGQTWTWDGASWVNRGPAPGSFGGIAWHAATQQLVGISSSSSMGLTTYTLNTWTGTAWTSLGNVAAGSASWPFDFQVGAYDPVRQESVFRLSGTQQALIYNGSTVSLRTMVSGPTAQSVPEAMAWDPVAQRVVLARNEGMQQLIGSTWVYLSVVRFYEWSGFGWNVRYPQVTPGLLGGMATDTQRNRILLFDGDGPTSQTLGANQPYHTWTYSNGTLTQLSPPLSPTPRENAAMTFDSNRGVIVLFGGTNGYGDTWEFDLGPLASYTSYGSGCTGTFGIPTIAPASGSLPRIGTTFTLQASNLPLSGPAFLAIGFSDTNYSGAPLPLDLGVIGAPGCNLLCAIDGLYPLTNVLGTATWSIGIPVIPGGRFFNQVIPFDPTANPLGLTTSNGGHAVLGL